MKILIINHYAGSLEYGMEYRPFYLAREWVKLGHTVDIIAANYSHLRKKNPIIGRNFESEIIDGITYHWVKTVKYKGNGIKRAISMFEFVIKLFFNAKTINNKLKPDIVISSSTYPLDTYPSQRIARLSNAKLVHEIHDMWPLTLIEIGGMSKINPLVMLMQAAENSFCKNSDIIVSLLPYAKDYLVKHGMKPDKFHYIPNGVVLEDWDISVNIPDNHKKVLQSLHEEGKFIVGYFGGHALSNALDVLLSVAKITQSTDIHYVLVGDGAEKANLQKIALDEHIMNITFLPTVSKLCIPNLLKYFDCIYIGSKNLKIYQFGTSINKFYDSMMAGKPIIFAVNSQNGDINEYKCGIAVNPDSIDDIVRAILYISGINEEERSLMGNNGKRAILDSYNYSMLSKKFLDILENNN